MNVLQGASETMLCVPPCLSAWAGGGCEGVGMRTRACVACVSGWVRACVRGSVRACAHARACVEWVGGRGRGVGWVVACQE